MSEWDKIKELRHTIELPRMYAYVETLVNEGDKLQTMVKYLDDLTDGNGEMLTAKLVEIQKLEQKLEAIKKARTFIQVKRCLMNE